MCSCKYCNLNAEHGFSLIELVIVIAIAGILSAMATIGFNQWLTKGRVEAQVKQMVSDINELRIRALTTKQRHNVTLDANSYTFKSYSSENQTKFNGNIISGGVHNVDYGLKKSSGSSYDGVVLQISENGMFSDLGATVFLDYAGSAAIDCLIISTGRVNPGKMNSTGDTCNDK